MQIRAVLLFAISLFATCVHVSAADLPAPEAAMTAYRTLDQWVRAWQTPDQPQMADPEGSHGTCVTLRLSGKVIGRGSYLAEDKTSLWQAARRAWREADAALNIERDAFADQRLAEAAKRITIDVEFAGALTPLLGGSFSEAAESLAPGIDGVAARVGDDVEPFFPAEMLGTDTLPPRGLQVAVGRLRLPPLELGQLREKQGLVVYRFRGVHLAQPATGSEPVFLSRGGRVVALAEVSGAGLRALADRIAKHLQTHKWPGEEPHGLLGNYLPLTDTYEPVLAPPREQAMVAIALASYARTPGIDAARATAALGFARLVVEKLCDVSPSETNPTASPTDAAAWLLADLAVHAAAPRSPRVRPEFAQAAQDALLAAWNDHAVWSGMPPAARALIACAMARLVAADDNASAFQSPAMESVRGLLRDVDSAELVGLMPWLGWAEMALTEASGPVVSGEALREMRSRVWQHQIQGPDVSAGDADLEGGIVFTRGGTPLPTWQCLRPLAFLAVMLGDARLTGSAELSPELANLRRSLRFVMQLTIDTNGGWLARDPERAVGGVRLAVWNQAASLDASALGLMVVCETLVATEARATATTPAKGPTGRPTTIEQLPANR